MITPKEVQSYLNVVGTNDTSSVGVRMAHALIQAWSEIEELKRLVTSNERLTEQAVEILRLVVEGGEIPSTAEFDRKIVRIVNDGIKTGHVTTLLGEVKR